MKERPLITVLPDGSFQTDDLDTAILLSRRLSGAMPSMAGRVAYEHERVHVEAFKAEPPAAASDPAPELLPPELQSPPPVNVDVIFHHFPEERPF